jgi:purine-nucleoside phosphorylase
MNLSLDAEVLPKAVRDFRPEWGLVLGSGLGPLVNEVDAILSLPYEEITGLPVSTVPGHAGRFVFGRLAGSRVLVAQGRVHLYEGRTAEEVTATVRFMDSLGVRKLVLTNAAGTLNSGFAPGTWMMLGDHLNLTGTSPLLGGANFVDMSAVYSPELRARFSAAAKAESVTLHEGVYAGLLGPQYETPAEVRMLRTLGADAVGMSTVLEAIQARALKMEVAGFSCLTNWAAGISGQALDHHEVLETGRIAAEQMMRILTRALAADGWQPVEKPVPCMKPSSAGRD